MDKSHHLVSPYLGNLGRVVSLAIRDVGAPQEPAFSGDYLNIPDHNVIVTPHDHVAAPLGNATRHKRGKLIDRGTECTSERPRGLDLHKLGRIRKIDEVDFLTSRVSIEVRLGHSTRITRIKILLHRLGDNKVLEHGTSHGAITQLLERAYTQEMAEQTGIVEIQLWGLDKPLANS